MLSCLYYLQGTENHSLKPSVCIVSIIAYTSLDMAIAFVKFTRCNFDNNSINSRFLSNTEDQSLKSLHARPNYT